jgi:type 2 lantibiotic biosynthesis protein LanM
VTPASDDTVNPGPLPPSWWTAALALHERQEAVERALSTGAAEPGTDPAKVQPIRLAEWTSAPAWARFVESAVAGGVRTERPAVSSEDWVAAFAVPLRHLADAAWSASVGDVPEREWADVVDLTAVRVGWVAKLGRELAEIAARTLVLELNVARAEDRLRGATPADRFVDFVLRTDTPDGLRDLLTRYPVLARLLGQSCHHAAVAHRELLDRFAADRADLVATLLDGTDPGVLVEVDRGQGDAHQCGRTVTVLRFAHGATVVYKPRPLDSHHHFGVLLRRLNEQAPKLGLRAPELVLRAGYGWQEFVRALPCDDLAGVDQFYRRYGALLALVWTLAGTDIHCENIIANADQPVIVDLETLFHPRLVAEDEDDPALHSLLASVYATAMLPQIMVGKHGTLDVSGLGGEAGALVPVDCVGWADPGTDTMRLIRTAKSFRGANNRPRLDNEVVDPTQHQAALLDGFRMAYGVLIATLTSAGDPSGPLAAFAADPVRVLARSTRMYSALLDESTHPDVLRDSLDREAVFEVLWARSSGDPLRSRLVPHELRALWDGDVPAFFTRPESRDVWAADGVAEPDLLRVSGLDMVSEAVSRRDEIDFYDQEWLVQATIAARPAAVDHRGGESAANPVEVILDSDALLSTASGIGDEIVARACHRDGAVNWLGLQSVDDRYWAVLPMGPALSDGYLGVALFLAQLGALTDEDRYTSVARAAAGRVDRLLTRLSTEGVPDEPVDVGGFHGLGGICYALSRLWALLGDERLLTSTARAVAVLRDVVRGSDRRDVGSGSAGALAALLAVHRQTGLDEAADLASVLAEGLAAHVRGRSDLPADGDTSPGGFLRGPAGAGWALARHGAARHDPAHLELGHRLLAVEPVQEDGFGWCRGLGGVLLAALDVGAEQAAKGLHAERLIAHPPTEDMSLCHGELGVLEVLTALGHNGDVDAAAQRQRRAGSLLAEIEVAGPRCGTPGEVAAPGLFTGLGGIGYGLLRLAFPQDVPSVLTLAV